MELIHNLLSTQQLPVFCFADCEHHFCISKEYKYSILAIRVGGLHITEMIHLIMYFALFAQYAERPDTHNGINHEMES